MAVTLFYIIIGILTFDFVLDLVLEYLNSTKWKSEIPVELKGLYDSEKYEKQQKYERETTRFGFFTDSFSFILTILMFAFSGFAIVDGWVREITTNNIVMALLYFGILMFVSDILSTPFSIYGTFKIEQKYGFNTTTPKIFILDKLKSWLLLAAIGGGLISLLIWFYTSAGELFWLYAWVAMSAFSIFMAMFYSSLIVPLFNKQTPLENGELRDKIEEFSNKAGFKLKNIYVIDGSKRSTKANAYFTGLGAKKRIVLYDTLIKDLSVNEIVAVLAHEVGHYKKKHTLVSILISVLQTGFMFYIFSLFASNEVLSQALDVKKHSFHIALITFGMLYSPFNTILGLIMNVVSRKNEYQADNFAAKYGLGGDLISALKKLSVNHLSNLTPHPAYVFVHYSHPTLLQRIRNINN